MTRMTPKQNTGCWSSVRIGVRPIVPALVAPLTRRWRSGLLRAVLVLAALWVAGMPAALLHAGTPVASAATTSTVTDLGTLGGTSSQATDINASGQVVGYVVDTTTESIHAFLLTRQRG